MKKIALALLYVFATGSAAAQTYACQFIMSAGMDKDPKSGWITKSYKVDDPFFLTMSNGLIDTKSVAEPPLEMSTFFTSCMKRESQSLGVSHWCADYSQYLSFSEKKLNGSLAKTFGEMSSPNIATADSVTVSRFKCQKVR
jgi:hypothetical protein